MLSQLYIENVAVIKKGEINFKTGFNVFTGETGAGKTILVSAINGIIGGKINKDIVRTGEEKAVITALFDNLSPEVIAHGEELGYDLNDELLISREITSDGKSSCRINGKPASLTILKELTSGIVDIHGQQDNNSLVIADKQLSLIDRFGSYEKELAEYRVYFKELHTIKEQIEALSINESNKAQKIDILQFQIKEISSAKLELGEDEELESQKKVILNSQQIISSLTEANEILNEDRSATDLLNELSHTLSTIGKFIPELNEFSDKCKEYYYELQELGSLVRNYIEDMDFNPNALDIIENRLDTIFKLKRKYGNNIEDISNFLDNAETELNAITFSEKTLLDLNAKYSDILLKTTVKANAITSFRVASSQDFCDDVKGELKFLDMPSVRLVVDITPKELSATGMDNLQILISVNPGEPPKAVSKIASGGEISRIMLAIKNVMAGKDKIPTMIFDEVDTGVSGRAAQKIGMKLKEAAYDRQVICVTHLAQVAAYGDCHFKISKEIINDRTFTTVVPLAEDERISELARIMVGENITDNALCSAKELLLGSKNI